MKEKLEITHLRICTYLGDRVSLNSTFCRRRCSIVTLIINGGNITFLTVYHIFVICSVCRGLSRDLPARLCSYTQL